MLPVGMITVVVSHSTMNVSSFILTVNQKPGQIYRYVTPNVSIC